jgi:hypothetical protein
VTNIKSLAPKSYGIESGVRTVIQNFHTNEAYRVGAALVWAFLWLIGCALAAMFVKRGHLDTGRRGRLSLAMLWTFTTLVVWILVIFTPGDTSLNAGPLTLVMVPMLVVSVVLMTWNSRVAWTILAVQGVLFAGLKIAPALPYTSQPINGSALVVFVGGFVMVWWVLASVARQARV